MTRFFSRGSYQFGAADPIGGSTAGRTGPPTWRPSVDTKYRYRADLVVERMTLRGSWVDGRGQLLYPHEMGDTHIQSLLDWLELHAEHYYAMYLVGRRPESSKTLFEPSGFRARALVWVRGTKLYKTLQAQQNIRMRDAQARRRAQEETELSYRVGHEGGNRVVTVTTSGGTLRVTDDGRGNVNFEYPD